MNVSNNSTDFYAKVFKLNPLLICCILISVLSIIICPLIIYCIIWFERYGSDQRRTLLNRFTTMYCWAMIQYFLIVQLIETARFIFGPLPAVICHLQSIVRSVNIDMVLICKAASILTKYVFIIWLKNPAGFNDDFWAFFAWMWIRVFTHLFDITIYLLGGNQPVTFYICCGTVRTMEQTKPSSPHNLGNNSTHSILKNQ